MALGGRPAQACDCDGKPHAANHAHKAAKAKKVSLVGTVVSVGCPMEAAEKACTGAALVVGEEQHMIKTAGKGKELATKTKDTNKTVKVTGTKAGEYLTVAAYQIKG